LCITEEKCFQIHQTPLSLMIRLMLKPRSGTTYKNRPSGMFGNATSLNNRDDGRPNANLCSFK
jgi:hypothetical protein